MADNASMIKLSIIDAEMISPKTYLASGGLMKEIEIKDIYNESVSYTHLTLPTSDLV